MFDVRDVTIAGTTAEPGALVTVIVRDDAGVAVFTQTLPADASGDWSFVAQGLANGAYTVEVSARDAANNMATPLMESFSVDATTPNLSVVAPQAMTTTNDPNLAIEGSTDPDATIAITVRDMQGAVVATLTPTVLPDGSFTIDVTPALADGDYTATVVATRPNGRSTTVTRDFSVDTTGPLISLTAPLPLTSDATPTIRGTSDPGATITIEIDGAIVGTTVVAPNGEFSFTPATPLADGPHVIVATATDAAGNSANDDLQVTIDTAPPALTLRYLSGGYVDFPAAVYPGLDGRLHKPADPVREQRVEVGHQHERRAGRGAQRFELLQDPAQADAVGDGGKARALDREAVGHRVGERHADLDHVADFGDRAEGRGEVVALRVARRQERHERGAAGAVCVAQRLAYSFMRLHCCSPLPASPGIGSGSACPCRRVPSCR